MITLPDETCREIIGHLDFGAVNPLARTCRRLARMISASALQIADRNTKSPVRVYAENRTQHITEIVASLLPNGVNHGRIDFHMRNKVIFSAMYSLGKPIFWRAMCPYTYYSTWGCASTPCFVHCMVEFEVRLNVRRPGGNVLIIRCNGSDTSLVIGNRRRDSVRPVPAPTSFIIDSDINLAEVQAWGDRVLHHARKIWPDLEPIDHIIDIFDEDPEIVEAIRKFCPSMEAWLTAPNR